VEGDVSDPTEDVVADMGMAHSSDAPSLFSFCTIPIKLLCIYLLSASAIGDEITIYRKSYNYVKSYLPVN
jgi:hypothetical protein